MVLWQYMLIAGLIGAITVLIGALLVYVGVLTNRIGRANATLRRIAESLVTAADRLRGQTPAGPAAEMTQPGEASVKQGGAGLLTVRDLKVIARAGRRSTDSAVIMKPGSGLYTSNGQQASGEVQSVPTGPAVSEELVAARAEVREALIASGELRSGAVSSAASEELVAARAEVRDALNESVELQSAAVSPIVSEDLQSAAVSPIVSEDLQSAALSPTVSEELQTAAATHLMSEELVGVASESRDALYTSGEPNSAAASPVVNEAGVSEQPVTENSHNGDVPTTSGEQQTTLDSQVAGEDADLIEKRNRDALLMLNSQRRRRRARGIY